jgi:pimeloyl-ACP methyl ester carboxylesterase
MSAPITAHATSATPEPLVHWLEAAWSRVPVVRTVGVEGAAVSYRDWGAPLRDKAAPSPGLVFVHGFLAHARWWDHIAPHFADRFQVIAPDFSGMGDSARRPAYSRRQYAHETLAALRDAGIGRATIVAHSFGSVSSLYAAKLAPELIERVVILDAHVFRPEVTEPDGTRQAEPEKRYASREEALARYRLIPPGRFPIPEVVDYLARHSLREIDGQWGWKFDPRTFVSSDRERLREDLGGLAVPVEFVRAANSEVVGDDELAAFVANVADCGEPVTVPLSHHHLMIEQPVALVAALQGLLARRR